MRVGVTGTRTLTEPQKKIVYRLLTGILSCYEEGDELHHGGARGVDEIAATVARRFGMKVVAHPAKEARWDGMSGYKARNMDIVNSSDIVYALHSPDSTTGGTIWTYTYAESLRKQVHWIELPSAKQARRN